MKLKSLIAIAFAGVFLLGACSQETKEFTYEKTDKDIDHIHGASRFHA